jgi:hypothetical protein
MATLNYWNGAAWKPIATVGTGSGGGTGDCDCQDGMSVNVFGPQVAAPIPERKGDVWLVDLAILKALANQAAALAALPDYQVENLVEPYTPTPYPSLQE